MSETAATYLEDEYHFVWRDLDIEIVVERIREERGALRADFSPQSVSGKGFLPTQTIDLISGESAKRYANVLGSRLLDGDIWFDLVTQAQRLTRDRYRSGEPSIVLADVDWGDRPRFLVYPFLEDGVRSILFGDGGVGKSLHMMALAVSVASGHPIIPNTQVLRTGPVVYLDWEDEAATHAERLAAICAGAEIDVPDNIVYMRRVSSLHESVREVRREIARTGAVLAVVDSVGASIGGDPEHAADVIKAFNAMRALSVAVGAVHHVTKDAKDRSKPFGSVYSANLARLTWRLDREAGTGGEMYVRAQQFKGNNTGDLAPFGHRVVFDIDDSGRMSAVRFTTAPSNLLPPMPGNGLRNRIAAALKANGALSVKDLATELDTTEQTIRTQLNRHKTWFQKLIDGRWGLSVQESGPDGSDQWWDRVIPFVAESEQTKPEINQPNNGLEQTKPPPPSLEGGLGREIEEEEEDDDEPNPF